MTSPFPVEKAGDDPSWKDSTFGVTGVEPAFIDGRTGEELAMLKFDSLEDLVAAVEVDAVGTGDSAPAAMVDIEEDEGTGGDAAGDDIVYWRTDSGDALLRLLSDLGGLAGDAPIEELFEEAPVVGGIIVQTGKLSTTADRKSPHSRDKDTLFSCLDHS